MKLCLHFLFVWPWVLLTKARVMKHVYTFAIFLKTSKFRHLQLGFDINTYQIWCVMIWKIQHVHASLIQGTKLKYFGLDYFSLAARLSCTRTLGPNSAGSTSKMAR
jgi:hypothetical protein